MHQNYYFLSHLASALDSELRGTRIDEIFTQQKDELVIALSKGEQTLFVQAHFGQSISCLSFPDKFSKKKTNTANLFKEIYGLEIISISPFTNERAFTIQLKEWQMVFQLFGNKSNIVIYHQDQAVDGFHKKYIDNTKPPSSFHRMLKGKSYEEWPTLKGFPTEIMKERQLSESPGEWHELITEFAETESYYIIRHKGRLRLSLVPFASVLSIFNNPMEAVTSFFFQFIKEDRLAKEKSRIGQTLRKRLAKTSNYISNTEKKLAALSSNSNHRNTGDLIMANLHRIPTGSSTVSLQNFENTSTVVIKLNPQMTAQKNAEKFYNKAKNQGKELKILSKNIREKKRELTLLSDQLEQLETLDSLPDIKKSFPAKPGRTKIAAVPFYEREFKGFRIFIGKGARQNDTMLQMHAAKEDLWLHAKDGPGSHVLIKQQPGKQFPKEVIEFAASLAAFYSKRKHDSLTPVIYTPPEICQKKKR